MSRTSNGTVVLALFALLVMATFTFTSCAGTQTQSVSNDHPEVDKNPMCGECHDGKEMMNHNKGWVRSTNLRGIRKSQTAYCAMVTYQTVEECVTRVNITRD